MIAHRNEPDTITSSEHYNHLFEAAPVGYLTLNRAGCINEVNATFGRLTGRDQRAMIDKEFSSLLPEAQRAAWSAFFNRMIHSDQRERCELMIQSASGGAMAALVEGVMDGKNEICLLSVTDISWFKESEEKRLLDDKLASNRTLAGGMAHDFNNLLSVILLNIDMTRMLIARGREMEDMLTHADTAVSQAARLTKRLLMFSDASPPVRQRVQLNELLRTCAELLLADTAIRLECDLDGELWPVEVDIGQFETAIRNVIMNACEAMPHGGTLRLESRNEHPPRHPRVALPEHPHVRLSVIDTGPGIPREILTRIFDPYFSTKQRGARKGMGIGLTISHAVMTRHDGAMVVASDQGRGTAAHFYVPAAIEDPAMAFATANAATTIQGASST